MVILRRGQAAGPFGWQKFSSVAPLNSSRRWSQMGRLAASPCLFFCESLLANIPDCNLSQCSGPTPTRQMTRRGFSVSQAPIAEVSMTICLEFVGGWGAAEPSYYTLCPSRYPRHYSYKSRQWNKYGSVIGSTAREPGRNHSATWAVQGTDS